MGYGGSAMISRISKEVQLVECHGWNYMGDVNLIHGGSFVRHYAEHDEYRVIKVQPSEGYDGKGFYISNACFEIDEESPQNIADVKIYIGFQEGKDDYLYLAIGVMDCYGADALGGEMDRYESLEEATEALIEWGVVEYKEC
jgi:hypothetical protein